MKLPGISRLSSSADKNSYYTSSIFREKKIGNWGRTVEGETRGVRDYQGQGVAGRSWYTARAFDMQLSRDQEIRFDEEKSTRLRRGWVRRFQELVGERGVAK